MSTLVTRTLTGVLYVAVMVFCTVYGAWTLGLLVTLLTLLAVRELLTICGPAPRTLISLGSLLFPLGVFLSFFTQTLSLPLLLTPYMAFIVFVFVRTLYQRTENPLTVLGTVALSQLYVVVPLSLLFVLAFGTAPVESNLPFWALPLVLYVFLWLNDSGAYLFGSLLGRHKLFPRISPGKTWEGSIGGGLVTVASSLLAYHFFPALALWQWMGMAAVTVLFGTWGDLTESLIKRTLGIKDSGHLLPGHGGILDRIDSMLMAVPAVIVFLLVSGCF